MYKEIHRERGLHISKERSTAIYLYCTIDCKYLESCVHLFHTISKGHILRDTLLLILMFIGWYEDWNLVLPQIIYSIWWIKILTGNGWIGGFWYKNIQLFVFESSG